ncbi:MAG: beta-propeller repeat protein, partial [Pseudonocardia sp.]|nr:beta-propeller repeat protein [Pseudonocardia sp.]
MGYSLGVDLGTTFVAAATAQDSAPEMFTLGDRSVVTPTAVYVGEDGTLLTGEAASWRAASDPDRAAQGFKRRLGDPTPMILGGERHTAVELLAAVLRDVLARVSATEGAPPDHVVLTHPANWGPFRRGLFEEVPTLAGLSDTVAITEPEAAAMHYAATRRLEDGQVVAVYDLGGGTFDVTVLRKRPDGIDILGAPEGIERLGGIDFDDAILSHVDSASNGGLRELDQRDPRIMVALARLRQDCVLAKETLSVDTEAVVPVFLPGRHFEVTITRTEFEELVRAQIESTVGALTRTLRSARITPDELSAVLLVGGSSRIPLVARMVSDELGRPTVVDTHPKYAVALGAAAHAALSANGTAGRPTPRRSAATAPPTPAPVAGPAPSPSAPNPPAASPSAPNQSAPSPSAPRPPAGPDQGPSGPDPDAPRTDEPAPVRERPAIPRTPATAQPARLSSAETVAVGTTARPRRVRATILVSVAAVAAVVLATTAVLTRGTEDTPAGTAPASTPALSSPGLSSPGLSAPPPVNTPPAIPALSVAGAVPVGLQPGRVAIAPDGRHAYVTNNGSNDVSVIDTVSNAVTATVVVGHQPANVAITPNGGAAYVTNYGSGTVSVIDTARNSAVTAIPVGGLPSGVAITPDGRTAYVANQGSATVSVIDTVRNSVTATIPVAATPAAVAISPDGRSAYLTNFGAGAAAGSVSAIDIATNAVTATVLVGAVPGSVAISPDSGHAYVTNFGSDTVSVIETDNNTVTATVPVGRNPANLAISPDGRHAYLTNQDANSVSLIDTTSNAVTATVPAGQLPNGLAITPDGRHA